MKKFLTWLTATLCAATLIAGCSVGVAAPVTTAEPTHVVSGTPESDNTSAPSPDETIEAAPPVQEAEPAASTNAAAASASTAPDVTSEATAPSNISPTTGLAGRTQTYRPIIVQIENEPPARPQSGLQWADVVYETMIEGVDTRFTCLFNDILYSDDSPETLEVGPVRSSRYYHQWIQGEWDALYVHQGGAETAGRESYIWGDSAEHIKQRINGAGKRPMNAELIYRRRNTGKALEHTAYTELHADSEIIEYEPLQFQHFKFYPAESYENEPEIDSIKLCFWHKPGFVEYKYDADTDKLIRYMGGQPFYAEETGEPLEVQNLIVQYTHVDDFPGEGGRKEIDMFGSGDAEFIIHGRHLTGTWSRKEGANERTVYRLNTGEEVTFAPGNTWIEVHPDDEDQRAVITYAGEEDSSEPDASADLDSADESTDSEDIEAAPAVDESEYYSYTEEEEEYYSEDRPFEW